MVENPLFGGIRPLTRAQEYYHLAKGGVNGGSLPALDTLSVMFYRHYPVADRFPDYDPDATDEDSIAVLRKYEYVLVWGESERLNRQLGQSSFECIHERKPFRLFRKQSP